MAARRRSAFPDGRPRSPFRVIGAPAECVSEKHMRFTPKAWTRIMILVGDAIAAGGAVRMEIRSPTEAEAQRAFGARHKGWLAYVGDVEITWPDQVQQGAQ